MKITFGDWGASRLGLVPNYMLSAIWSVYILAKFWFLSQTNDHSMTLFNCDFIQNTVIIPNR